MSTFGHIRNAGWVAALVLLAGAGLTACNCDSPPVDVDGGDACTTDEDCQQRLGTRWYCDSATKACVEGPRYCEDSGDVQCCPGQVCNRTGICVDKYDVCTGDEDCSVAGQRCLARTVNGAEQRVCQFDRCDDGVCDPGLHCFAGWCVGENPCGGGCPVGEACAPTNNRCQAAQPGCDATCAPGTLATYSGTDNFDDTCNYEAIACGCEALPPLAPRDIGRHSALARLPDGTLAVSAYEGDHGDLVLVSFDAVGNRTGMEWVDGLPSGGVPTADPAGPRGGIADPGPHVGLYTDIVAGADGSLHISYQDADWGDLKYARRTGGVWSVQRLDEPGDTGLHTSIALDADGHPVIAYFQRAGADADALISAVRVARARSAAPAGPEDWDLVTVASAPVPPPPCGGDCAAGTACVDLGSGPECRTVVVDCAAACGSGQRCVDTDAGSQCRDEAVPSPVDDLPEGTGLFPSVVASEAGIAVSWYDRNARDLKLALGVDPAAGSPGSLHTPDGRPDSDAGAWPSLTMLPGGDWLIAYHDATETALRFVVVAPDGTIRESGVADDGKRDPRANGASRVGVDNAVSVGAGGRWYVVHQDATAGDLVLAVRSAGGTWSQSVIASEGAGGFFADAVLADRLLVSHAVILGTRSAPLTTDLQVRAVTP